MIIERTEDKAYMASVLLDPAIAHLMRDDGTPTEFDPMIHPLMYYLIPKMDVAFEPGIVESVPIGLVVFNPCNSTTWNPHIGILPKYWGHGTEALLAGIDWMFKNVPACLKMVCFPPVYNPRMIRVFQKCHFQIEGMSSKSILHDGKLWDRMVMGLEKGAYEFHQAAG